MWGPAQVGFHSRLSSEFRSFWCFHIFLVAWRRGLTWI
jgi:hypothetical protein